MAQRSDNIISCLKATRESLNGGRISDALQECMKIKFLGMSFASKVIAFMNPTIAAVYDDVISSRLLLNSNESLLRNMHISTKLARSHKGMIEQAKKYKGWCRWCYAKAAALNEQDIF